MDIIIYQVIRVFLPYVKGVIVEFNEIETSKLDLKLNIPGLKVDVEKELYKELPHGIERLFRFGRTNYFA